MAQEGTDPRGDPADPKSVAHFRILGRLGQGGMGVVYRAEDETLRRTVALKLLPDTAADEETRQRFLREARSAAAIGHTNVAVIHQIGEAYGFILDHWKSAKPRSVTADKAKERVKALGCAPHEGKR